MYEFEFADHHLIAGSRTFVEIDKATKTGTKYYELTFEVVQADENSGGKLVRPLLQSMIRDAPAARK